MANILILYYSKTGNTAKMAQYVAQGTSELPGINVRLRSVHEATVDDIRWFDGIAVGSPTQLGLMAADLKKFWEENTSEWMKIDGKIGCAFSSQGGWGGGAELTCQSITTLLMNFGILVFGVTDYVAHQYTLHYGSTQAGEPRTDKEIASCKRLGHRLAEWCLVLIEGKKEFHPINANYSRHPDK